jgi:hypothetical protein
MSEGWIIFDNNFAAKAISKELYKISQPKLPYGDGYLLMHTEHLEQSAIYTDGTEFINVHPEVDLSALAAMVTATNQEKKQLIDYIMSQDKVYLKDILPSSAVIIPHETMKVNGWFSHEDL